MQFTPQFPRSISGGKPTHRRFRIRIPLDHFECEAIAKRINRLIFSGMLTEGEIGFLIKTERDLRKVDYRLARRLFERPLPRTDLRPMFWDDHRRPLSPAFNSDETETWVGWVHRLREYVERIEAKYRLTSRNDGGPDEDV